MTLPLHTPPYPGQSIRVVPFPADFTALFEQPAGFVEGEWPPLQLTYLDSYLRQLGCKTIVVEEHYIDRDFISDVAAFYSRSLRDYPNHCQRLHFFSEGFLQEDWMRLILQANGGKLSESKAFLDDCYLGFSVLRPLPGCPVGRTVLKTFPEVVSPGVRRLFDGIRAYGVHLAGFTLGIRGLAFQQQDRGVSACATTALWSAMHKTAQSEGLAIPTPAEITEAASRYFLPGGRSLPSEGLTVHQICEATRAAGLAPIVIPSLSPEIDKAQLLAYIRSGFPALIALESLQRGQDGHAVCCVGVKLGAVQPQTDASLHFRDAATALDTVYLHDDRLGPYASADIVPFTVKDPFTNESIRRTGVSIRWPGTAAESELSLLRALIVPVPLKLRLAVTRMRALGMSIADAVGEGVLPQFSKQIIYDCRFRTSHEYMNEGFGFGLSNSGIHQLTCQLAMSRYIGVVEFTCDAGPLFDLVLDATDTQANPAALAVVRRVALPKGEEGKFRVIAKRLAATFIE